MHEVLINERAPRGSGGFGGGLMELWQGEGVRCCVRSPSSNF